MPIMNLPADMRALCGFYALGKRVTEIPAPEIPWSRAQGRYLLAPGPDLHVNYWSHSESMIIADGQVHIFEFYVPEPTRVESVLGLPLRQTSSHATNHNRGEIP